MSLLSNATKINNRRHVFHDLRPYVCTFENCNNSSKLYASRAEWIFHEFLVHRRRFVCNQTGCNKSCQTKVDFEAHLQRDHFAGTLPLSSGDLSIFFDICDRPIDISEPIHDQTCGLCYEPIQYVDRLQKHLAGHMEDLALFVLPVDPEQSDIDQGSHNSARNMAGSKTGSHRNIATSLVSSSDITDQTFDFSQIESTQPHASFITPDTLPDQSPPADLPLQLDNAHTSIKSYVDYSENPTTDGTDYKKPKTPELAELPTSWNIAELPG